MNVALLILILFHKNLASSAFYDRSTAEDPNGRPPSPTSSPSTSTITRESLSSPKASIKSNKVIKTSKNSSKRSRTEGCFTKEGRIARLTHSISMEKPHLGEEGAYIAAKNIYLQKSRQTNKRYREKQKALGIQTKDSKPNRTVKPKPENYYSIENRTNRKAFTILKSKDNKITKFDEARKEAEKSINQWKVANRIRMREKYNKKKKQKI